MSASHRRAAVRVLTALAFGALVLTGCGEKEEPAAPVAVATTDTPPAPAGEMKWAGTKQFVTIDKAWTEGGLTRLSVRPAQKEINTQFDTWVIVPGTGPFTTVVMAEDGRVLLTAPVRGDDEAGVGRGEPLPTSQAEFVTLLKQMDSGISAGVGYDLSFDGDGRVTKVQSQYRQ